VIGVFVVVWYADSGRGYLVYSGGKKFIAETAFKAFQAGHMTVEYQEWDDEGTLVHYKYRGAGHCED